jgi:hypothetical protein
MTDGVARVFENKKKSIGNCNICSCAIFQLGKLWPCSKHLLKLQTTNTLAYSVLNESVTWGRSFAEFLQGILST